MCPTAGDNGRLKETTGAQIRDDHDEVRVREVVGDRTSILHVPIFHFLYLGFYKLRSTGALDIL